MQISSFQKRLLVVPLLIIISFASAGVSLTAMTQVAQAQPLPGDGPPPPPPRRWQPPPPDDDGPPPPRRGGRPRIRLNIGF
jgi:hypothetical protein